MLTDKKRMRKHLYVDSKVQGALVSRALLYWAVCLIAIALLLLCWQILTSPPQMFYMYFNNLWFFFGPAAIASLLLVPVVVMDVIRISNRFVGPLLRLRRSMRELARGEDVGPLEFRDNDFWQDFADEFNAVRNRMQQLSAKTNSDTEHEEPLGVGS
jgi:hypothetical protein